MSEPETPERRAFIDDTPAEDVWVNARDLYRFLLWRHHFVLGAEKPDSWGMYPPDLSCLRAILRGDPKGCQYVSVRVGSPSSHNPKDGPTGPMMIGSKSSAPWPGQ